MTLDQKDLDKIPQNITRFRFENSLMSIKKGDNEKIDMYIKNVGEQSHLHLFINKDQEMGIVLTKENKRNTAKEHTKIDHNEFLMVLKDFGYSMWNIMEKVDPYDQNLIGKKVVLYTNPEIA